MTFVMQIVTDQTDLRESKTNLTFVIVNRSSFSYWT